MERIYGMVNAGSHIQAAAKLGIFCLNPNFFLAGLHPKSQAETGTVVHRNKLNAVSFTEGSGRV